MALVKRGGLARTAAAVEPPVAVVDPRLAGDTEIERQIGDLYERLGPILRRIARGFVGDDLADDVVHDVIATCLARKFTPEQRGDKAIMSAVANRARDVRRHERHTVHVSDADFAEIPMLRSQPLDVRMEARNAHEVALRHLAQSCREVHTLAIAGFACREIAELLGVSVSLVKLLRNQGLTVAREVFAEAGYRVAPPTPRTALPATTEASDE